MLEDALLTQISFNVNSIIIVFLLLFQLDTYQFMCTYTKIRLLVNWFINKVMNTLLKVQLSLKAFKGLLIFIYFLSLDFK